MGQICMGKLEWCVGATVVALCGAGWEEGFIYRGVRVQRSAGVKKVQLLFDCIAQVATRIYK